MSLKHSACSLVSFLASFIISWKAFRDGKNSTRNKVFVDFERVTKFKTKAYIVVEWNLSNTSESFAIHIVWWT